ncbi:hypothetical protein UlMin_033913 [Ulmus minor]
MEEEDTQRQSSEIREEGCEKRNRLGDEHVLEFLDSLDDYLTQMDSLSVILRQGWLELASARHSMGASRVNGALLDLKLHSAATTLRVAENEVDLKGRKAHFTLSKWGSSENGKFGEDKLQSKSDSPQLRHRSTYPLSETPEKTSHHNGTAVIADDQVQKERLKSLSVFGGLVSPKLRASQLSFETALEKLVEIANTRSALLSAFDQVKEQVDGSK